MKPRRGLLGFDKAHNITYRSVGFYGFNRKQFDMAADG